MSKRLSNSKRLQLINKWLRGIDDDDYEVFPCKTEGKYFVRPRKNKLKQTTKDTNDLHSKTLSLESEESTEATEPIETEPIQEEPIETESIQEEPEEPKEIPNAKSKPKTRQQTNLNTHNQYYDPTINIEILNQLKLLGEEFKNEREKKEQKRMIKEAVQKQISKPRLQYNYTEPAYVQQPNLQQEEIQQTYSHEELCSKPILTRKNNIFADMM